MALQFRTLPLSAGEDTKNDVATQVRWDQATAVFDGGAAFILTRDACVWMTGKAKAGRYCRNRLLVNFHFLDAQM